MKKKIAIISKYHAPTNFRDARVSLSLPHWGNRHVFFDWDDTLASTIDQVEAWAQQHNIVVESVAEIRDVYVFIVDFSQVNQVKRAFKIKE